MYVQGGVVGNVGLLEAFDKVLIAVQLAIAGILVLQLDDLLEKGYGLYSGLSLFVVCNIINELFWENFSPMTLENEHGTEYEGAAVSFFHLLYTKPDKVSAVQHAFFRQSGPNLFSLTGTVVLVLFVAYLYGCNVKLNLVHETQPEVRYQFSIKLLYTSNMSTAIYNLFFVSQLLYRSLEDSLGVRMLGTWQEVGNLGH